MKVLFMGTPEFAVPCLKALGDAGHTLCGVVTQPDKPQGRGNKLTPPPVKVMAQEMGARVFQPETLKDFAFKGTLDELNPDLIVVVAYGKILPEYILNFPKYGCINMHASILPKYRGAGPIQWSVINGEKVTGITSMLMEKGLDTGDMLLKAETPIGDDETSGELHDRLMHIGADLLIETINGIENGSIVPEKQNDEESCYAPMLTKDLAKIDWTRSSDVIYNLIRGMNPWPVAHTLYMGEMLKVYQAKKGGTAKGKSGEILSATKDGIDVLCGDGKIITLMEIQFKGQRRMSVRDYLNGHEIITGEILD